MKRKLVVFSLLAIILLGSVCYLGAEYITFKSPLVWRQDTKGDYSLPIYSAPGVYELQSPVKTEGQIVSITASWESKGDVQVELSADGGSHFTPVVNAVPLVSGFRLGSSISWRVSLGVASQLNNITVSYTDTTGVAGSFGQPQLSGFMYRKPLRIISDTPTEHVFNYQVNVKVAESIAGSFIDADIGCNNKISEFSEVRFTCADGETPIPFYLDSVTGTQPNRIASFWIKIPQIPPEGVTAYLYYSNPLADDLSAPENVFDLYDGFDDAQVADAKWEVKLQGVGRARTSKSQLRLESAEIKAKNFELKNGIIEFTAKAGKGNNVQAIIRGDKNATLLENASQSIYSSNYEGAEHAIVVEDIVKANLAEAITKDTIYNYRIIANDTNLDFKRYSNSYNSLEAEIQYDDVNGLTQGYVGFKVDAANIIYIEEVRIRKYAGYDISVDREAGQKVIAEILDLPRFDGVKVAEQGDLALADGVLIGHYFSKTVALPYNVRVFLAYWKTMQEHSGDMKINISLDGGRQYVEDASQGEYYYLSQNDFTSTGDLKFGIDLELVKVDESSPRLEKITVDYRPGSITLIEPSSPETFQGGDVEKITWSADDYESTYLFSLEESLDNGKTYKTIITATPNTGNYNWTVPSEPTTEGLVKVSDSLAPEDVYDVSDNAFTIISGEEPEVEEPLTVTPEPPAPSEEPVIAMEDVDFDKLAETVGRAGTKLYDLLIKLGDNYNPDPKKDAEGCFKHGDVVMVKLSENAIWSETERKSFLIAQLYLTGEEAKQLMMPKTQATGESDVDGMPVMKKVRTRAHKINLRKLGFSKNDLNDVQEKERKLRTIRDKIKGKALKREKIIEEKID